MVTGLLEGNVKGECVVSNGQVYGRFSFSDGFHFEGVSERDEFRRNPDQAISNRLGQAQTLFLRGERGRAKEMVMKALAMADLIESFSPTRHS